MSRRETFEVIPPVRIDVETRSGSVDVRTCDGPTVIVTIDGQAADDWDIAALAGAVTIRPGWGWRAKSARITIETPTGTDLEVRGASTDVSLFGTLGTVRLRTASGDVRADRVGSLEVNTASGDVRAQIVDGDALVTTVAGDIELQRIGGRLTASTASGDVRVLEAGGDVHAGTTSGDVRIGRFGGDQLSVKCVSGDVDLKLPAGIRVEPDLSTLSGRTRLPRPSTGVAPSQPADTDRRVVKIAIRTVSGDISIDRA